MKYSLTFVLFSLFVLKVSGQDVRLNNVGHIINSSKTKYSEEYSIVDGVKVIKVGNLKFEGNGLYITNSGYLSVEAYEASVPVLLRFYNEEGVLKKELQFNRVYGLEFSPNKEFAIFYDANELVTINSSNFEVKRYPGSPIYCIDDQGVPAFFIENNNEIAINEKKFAVPDYAYKIITLKNQTFVFTRNNLFLIEEGELRNISKLHGSFFQAKSINNILHFSTKSIEPNAFVFRLFKLENSKSISEIESTTYPRGTRTISHETIPSPLKYGENFAHPIGNSYGEIQQYGGLPYLHPGVDFLGDANENVYSVKDGVVKAILTTGGMYNWRIAIANENTNEETHGYLYAHLIETSIPYAVGDSVFAGDVVGELVYWPWYNFTHIHFARIKSQGEVWNGSWWTTNNPHIDVEGFIDNTPPVFENAKGNHLFAFRDVSFNYLDPMQLNGEIKIISKVHDLANSHWKIDVYEISYKISNPEDPDNPLLEMTSFAYDFMLDTYFSNEYESKVIETIYSRDGICFSFANYEQRHFYQIVTNTSGDESIQQGDKDILLDTRTLPDGIYTLSVTAKDASMNETLAEMTIGINNSPTDVHHTLGIESINVYPNPTNDFLTVNNAENFNYLIVDISGIIIKSGKISSSIFSINLSSLKSGIYTIVLYKRDYGKVRKRIIKI